MRLLKRPRRSQRRPLTVTLPATPPKVAREFAKI
jgi:hypothetical protein